MIYLTCKDYFPGVRAVLRHVESLGLGKMIGDISGTGSLQYLIKEDDTVIFGAWDQSYALPLMRLKCKKAILWTSSPGQMEMSPGSVEIEMWARILKMQEQGKLDEVYVISREMSDAFKLTHFPAPFDIKLYEKYKIVHFEDKIPYSIGLFIPSASNVRKNFYNQKIAVKMVQRQNPDAKLISNSSGWIERQEDYLDLLSSVMVNLHVTHSESFCYQAAEAIALGTISLVSPCIQENLGLGTPFVVHNPDSPSRMALWIQDILEMTEGAYKEWLGIQQKDLIKTAEKNNNLLRLLLS